MAGSLRRGGLVAILVSLALLTSGCVSGSSTDDASGSRAVLYDSIEGLASDSTAIVVGTVTEQRTDGDATVSTVDVISAPASPGLGSTAPEAEPVVVGDLVEVRQDPSSRPLLEVGAEYALWLTPTMLPDAAASQFFITGSNAGLYIVDGDVARRAATDTGDDLPDTISIEGRPS